MLTIELHEESSCVLLFILLTFWCLYFVRLLSPPRKLSSPILSHTAFVLALALPPLAIENAVAEEKELTVSKKPSSILSTQKEQGYACTGYHPTEKNWGTLYSSVKRWVHCPPQWGIMGTTNPRGNYEKGQVLLIANCCPLPFSDILSSEHILADWQCPKGFVITGMELHGKCNTCTKQIRCTKLNTKKYDLGQPKQGIHWGLDTSSAFPWKENKMIRRDEIPLAIRLGIARGKRGFLFESGCVGDPIGSLLTAKKKADCKGLLWQRLFHKHSNGKRTPVTMFPNCKQPPKIFSTELQSCK